MRRLPTGRNFCAALFIFYCTKQLLQNPAQFCTMKIILTGSLGNIGQPLATALVQQSHAVTVISSKPDKQAAI